MKQGIQLEDPTIWIKGHRLDVISTLRKSLLLEDKSVNELCIDQMERYKATKRELAGERQVSEMGVLDEQFVQ